MSSGSLLGNVLMEATQPEEFTVVDSGMASEATFMFRATSGMVTLLGQ